MLRGMQSEETDRQPESSARAAPPPYSTDGHPSLDPRARTVESRPTQSWRRWPLLIATVLFVLFQAGPWLLGSLGAWLVVEDEIGQTDVIFVHSSDVPYRAMEAAELYGQGRAPEVWIAALVPSERSRALERIGMSFLGSHYWERQILQRLGVPAGAIRVMDTPVLNTLDEIDALRAEMLQLGRTSVILVTSRAHSRRVRLLWSKADDASIEGAVRWARADPFDPDRWWTNTDDGKEVVHELLGILDMWVGTGLRPKRQE